MKTVLRAFREGLWFCAGADLSIARKVRSELVILDSIGASVLGTMLLAFLTSTYAAFFVFNDHSTAIGFGCLWAALIFNFDRYSVASIRKTGSFAQDVLVALPRMILACLIAVIIVIPLELRLFEAEIEEKLPEYYVNQVRSYEITVENSHLGSTVKLCKENLKSIENKLSTFMVQRTATLSGTEASALQSALDANRLKIEELREEIENAESKKAGFERLSVEEKEGLRESQKDGEGPIWRALQANVEEQNKLISSRSKRLEIYQNDQKELRQRLSNIGQDERIEQLKKDHRLAEEKLAIAIKKKKDDIDQRFQQITREQAASLLTRLKIIQKLIQESPTVEWTVMFLRLLVAAFELGPIFLKLLSERGPYDAWRDKIAQLEISEADGSR